jgi:Mn2+/Fe2+ NRAMP family transporter
MHIIFVLLLLGMFAAGVAAGVTLTIARHQAITTRQNAYEEELAEVEELFAAWAALRAGVRIPPPDNTTSQM